MNPTLANLEQEVAERSRVDETGQGELAVRSGRERSVARLRLLWERRKFLLRFAWRGLLVSTLVALLIPRRYEATARLMPPESPTSAGGMLAAVQRSLSAGASSLGGSALGGSTGGLQIAQQAVGVGTPGAPLLVGVLKSETVQDDVIHKFDLQRIYDTRYPEDTRSELAAHTGISEDVLNGIITINVTDRDPERAAAMATEYIQELNRVVSRLSTSSARRERIFLEGRLKTVKEDLDQSAVAFSQFSSKNTAIDIKEQGKAMVEAAAALQAQLIATQTEQEGLRQIYTDNNIRVRALSARIAELKHQLDVLAGKDVNALADIDGDNNQLYPSIRKLPLLGVTYSDLYRRTRINEIVYELLTQQYEMARVQEAKEIPTVKLLDAPLVPQKKSFPPLTLLISLGTVLTMALGVAWVLGTAHWEGVDQTDPRKIFAQEVFATLKPQGFGGSRNGSRLRAISEKVLNRLPWHKPPVESQPSSDKTAAPGSPEWESVAKQKAVDDGRP